MFCESDVSSAPSSKCEVKASCSESASCQITKNITVNPGLKIPPNCAINVRRKGNIHTWQQAKQQIGESKGLLDLVLQEKGKSKNGKYICQCTAVHFTRKQLLIYLTWLKLLSAPTGALFLSHLYLSLFDSH